MFKYELGRIDLTFISVLGNWEAVRKLFEKRLVDYR